MSATSEKYYPALHLGEFDDGHAALLSVGMTGALADLCVAGMDDFPDAYVAYEAQIIGSAEPEVKTILILAPTERGTVDLCYGYPDLTADTEEEALMLAVQGIERNIEGDDIKEPMQLMAFQMTVPRRVLQ